MFINRSLAALLVLSYSAILAGTQPKITEIKVVSDLWEPVTRKDGSGLFFDLIRLVYADSGITMTYTVEPYMRTVEDVRGGIADCWIASFLDEQPFPLYPKWHIDNTAFTVVFKKEKFPEWHGQTSLQGKMVIWQRGYQLNKYLDVKVFFSEVNNLDSIFPMLKVGRMDAFIAADHDIRAYIKSSKQDMTQYRLEPLLKIKNYVAFANNERGRQLRKIWDLRMSELVVSAQLKVLYKKYDVPYPF